MSEIDLIERNCPLCRSDKHSSMFLKRRGSLDLMQTLFSPREIPKYNSLQFNFCKKCDVIYASPALPQDVSENIYKRSPLNSIMESSCASKTYMELFKKFRTDNLKKESALDIGCSDGIFLDELRRIGFKRVVGVEPSQEAKARAHPSIKNLIRNEIFDQRNFEKESFDLISCFQSFEHFFDPQEIMNSIFNLLNCQGVGVFVFHDFSFYLNKLMGKRSPIYDLQHYQLFSQISIKLLLKNAGFRKVEIKRFKNQYSLIYWSSLFPFSPQLKKNILPKIKILQNALLRINVGNLFVLVEK